MFFLKVPNISEEIYNFTSIFNKDIDMKKILGLDLGTNSIGWAVLNADTVTRADETVYLKPTGISSAGSRIIPMSQDILGDFNSC